MFFTTEFKLLIPSHQLCCFSTDSLSFCC